MIWTRRRASKILLISRILILKLRKASSYV
jgi:hypothetical protein